MMDEVFADDAIVKRPTTAFVDLDALAANVRAIRARVGGRPIMGVVKANAYGHGLVPVARALIEEGVEWLGVAFLEEGITLRRAGITAPILVLGGLIGNQISHFVEHDLTITASSPFKLRQIEAVARALGRRAQVHLKIDTGMERIGIHHDTAERLLAASLEVEGVDVTGVFSHFATSDAADPSFARLQIERFEAALGFYARRGVSPPLRHMANSGAILQHPAAHYDLVRPGCLLYGFYPSPEVERSVSVRPVLSLKTRVVYFKVVRAGASVSYNRAWRAERDTRVVTLPVGYGDGYSRTMSGKAEVLIGGRRRPVIGAITMDALMVDIDDDSAFNGDEVVLIGAQGGERLTVEELAGWMGTIPYEILTGINTRVPRVYVRATGR